MSSGWKIFMTIEAVLFVWLLYQLFTNPFLLLLVGIGLFLILGNRFSILGSGNASFLIGIILLIFALLSTNALWIMLVVGVIFFSRKIYAVFAGETGSLFSDVPWREKQFVSLEGKEKSKDSITKQKVRWIGNQSVGETIYEWGDINYSQLAGDTIIDVENTILPKGQNIVLIRKGFGKTRILVPEGVGVLLDFSSLASNVTVNNETVIVQNERLKWKTDQFSDQNRQLKIVMNVLVGDLEVIRI